jgi:hypothetical protein
MHLETDTPWNGGNPMERNRSRARGAIPGDVPDMGRASLVRYGAMSRAVFWHQTRYSPEAVYRRFRSAWGNVDRRGP